MLNAQFRSDSESTNRRREVRSVYYLIFTNIIPIPIDSHKSIILKFLTGSGILKSNDIMNRSKILKKCLTKNQFKRSKKWSTNVSLIEVNCKQKQNGTKRVELIIKPLIIIMNESFDGATSRYRMICRDFNDNNFRQ